MIQFALTYVTVALYLDSRRMQGGYPSFLNNAWRSNDALFDRCILLKKQLHFVLSYMTVVATLDTQWIPGGLPRFPTNVGRFDDVV